VVACGVRKIWKKEFADLDTPSGQIKRLKEILKDLGMTGRLTLEKAKAIKAEREFAQELSTYLQRLALKTELIVTLCVRGCARFRRSGTPARDEERKRGIRR
jgi:hypothetical protein